MNQSDFSPSQRIEATYRRSLKTVMKEIVKTIASLDITDPSAILAALREFANSRDLRQHSYAMASRMITGVYAENARTWREAARESMKGRQIYIALQRELQGPLGTRIQSLIDRNAELIKTFPLHISTQVSQYVNAEAMKGRRPAAIAADLVKQFPDVSESRINLIARTETSKAYTELTRARAENLGLEWYVWNTSDDARVRKAHRRLDGVLVSWSDPPSPEELEGINSTLGHYHAGSAPNCRCIAQPLLRLDQVQWPCQIYRNGAIEYTTWAQFKKTEGLQDAA